MKRDYAQAAEGKREALVVNDESLKILVALQFLFCGGCASYQGYWASSSYHADHYFASLHQPASGIYSG